MRLSRQGQEILMRFAGLAMLVVGLGLFSSSLSAAELVVRVEAGQAYRTVGRFGPLKFEVTPQMAIWLEDEKGHYLESVYVTRSSAKGNWRGLTRVRRPEALPVWSHRRGIRAVDGLYMPDAANPLPDTVSGATPAGSSEWRKPLVLKPGRYVVWLEVNNSFDFNSFYAKGRKRGEPGYCADNGQPSLVYRADLNVDSKPVRVCLEPVGHGHVLGLDGSLQRDLISLTSAVTILRQVCITYQP
ncbi:MAG: hypothetical protein BWY87_00933 [Deltaproteobacteria bacterium ADurb.Bin510]|nr:MAG: hypothetical protein BWY87_00933 [Deltaproteobacteria bacterium ADurb.Bin510]